VVFFLFDVVASLTAGVIAGIAAAVAMIMWLLVYPLALRRSGTAGDDEPMAAHGAGGERMARHSAAGRDEPSDAQTTDGREEGRRPSAAEPGHARDEERADHG
jgi:MFS superfamily sulfate permease-like transporter